MPTLFKKVTDVTGKGTAVAKDSDAHRNAVAKAGNLLAALGESVAHPIYDYNDAGGLGQMQVLMTESTAIGVLPDGSVKIVGNLNPDPDSGKADLLNSIRESAKASAALSVQGNTTKATEESNLCHALVQRAGKMGWTSEAESARIEGTRAGNGGKLPENSPHNDDLPENASPVRIRPASGGLVPESVFFALAHAPKALRELALKDMNIDDKGAFDEAITADELAEVIEEHTDVLQPADVARIQGLAKTDTNAAYACALALVEAYKPLSTASYMRRQRSRKVQTAAKRMANVKRRRAYRQNRSKIKMARRRWMKKVGSRINTAKRLGRYGESVDETAGWVWNALKKATPANMNYESVKNAVEEASAFLEACMRKGMGAEPSIAAMKKKLSERLGNGLNPSKMEEMADLALDAFWNGADIKEDDQTGLISAAVESIKALHPGVEESAITDAVTVALQRAGTTGKDYAVIVEGEEATAIPADKADEGAAAWKTSKKFKGKGGKAPVFENAGMVCPDCGNTADDEGFEKDGKEYECLACGYTGEASDFEDDDADESKKPKGKGKKRINDDDDTDPDNTDDVDPDDTDESVDALFDKRRSTPQCQKYVLMNESQEVVGTLEVVAGRYKAKVAGQVHEADTAKDAVGKFRKLTTPITGANDNGGNPGGGAGGAANESVILRVSKANGKQFQELMKDQLPENVKVEKTDTDYLVHVTKAQYESIRDKVRDLAKVVEASK